MDAHKKQMITLRILAMVAAGIPVRQAIDEVLGAGTSAAVIDAVWEAAQKR